MSIGRGFYILEENLEAEPEDYGARQRDRGRELSNIMHEYET